MGLAPDITETLSRARGDLRMGVPVVLLDPGGDALVLAAETVGPERLAAARALGAPVLAITGRRAETLRARAYDGDVARIRVPSDADAAWIASVADPAGDLSAPMKGPLASDRGGSAALHRAAIALVKAARLLPAALVVPVPDGVALAAAEGLTWVAARNAAPDAVAPLRRVVAATVPLESSETSRLHIFKPKDGAEEHYGMEIGTVDRDGPVLCRLHSACFTGDVMGSLKCDCGPQLHAALRQMGEAGAGVLLYLSQEGRGIGLANKMRAYSLQDQGFDTVEANHRLGFEDDERDFRVGAALLRSLGIGRVRLLTNNPAKVTRLESCGIEVVERVPLRVGETRFNHHYLATKAAKSGHLL